MKRIIIATLLLLTIQQSASAQVDTNIRDTIYGRCSRYYYYSWYDTCPFFLNQTDTLAPALDRLNYYAFENHLFSNKNFTPRPLAVKGIAAMVFRDEDLPPLSLCLSHSAYSPDNGWLPEYLSLWQQRNDSVFLVSDTLRFDTVTPRLITLPLTSSADTTFSCLAYEVFFDKPPLVDSFFFVAGTGNSNNGVVDESYPPDMSGHVRRAQYYKRLRYAHFAPTVCLYSFTGPEVIDCQNQAPMYYLIRPGYILIMNQYKFHWGGIFAIVDFDSVAVLCNDSLMGHTEGSGRFSDLTFVELSAHPSPGFRFSHWNDGNTDNPRSVYLTSDTAFTAFFRPEERYVVDAFSSDTARGTVVGSGVYPEGSSVTLAAAPRHGFLFQRWNDLSTDNPRSFIVTQDTEFTALFVLPGSVSSPDSEPLFSLNPTPARESVTVTLSPSLSDLHGCRLTLHDAAGHELLAIPLDSRQLTIPTAGLPAGLYLFTLHSPQGSHTARLVIE
jgi:hypothetical protein